MNKAVMISIQPKWVELIANGKKTIEVRKTKPNLDMPFKCYIYQTKKNWIYRFFKKLGLCQGKVIGEFVCDKIDTYYYEEILELPFEHDCYEYSITNNDLIDTCLTYEQLKEYGNKKDLYGLHISNLKIYNKPKKLREFRMAYKRDSENYIKCDINPCSFVNDKGHYIYDCTTTCPHLAEKYAIKQPPQSWYYVNELEV